MNYHTASITDNGEFRVIQNPYVIDHVAVDYDVVVTFALDTFVVGASAPGGHGTVSPTTQTVAYGGTASIDINPYAGYHIGAVTDNGNSVPVSDPYFINDVAAGHSVVVAFEPDSYTVSASAPGGHGTVSPATQAVAYDGTAAVEINPEAGYHVETIGDNGKFKSVSSPYIISGVRADHVVVVTFALDEYTVYAGVQGAGGREDPSTQKVMYGHAAAIDIYPNGGFVIASIKDNGWPMPVADPYYVEDVKEDHDVVLSFRQGEHPTWYLAEGSTDYGFSTYISIENPTTSHLNANLTYMMSGGATKEQAVGIPAMSQVTVNPTEVVGEADFSTVVECVQGKTIAVDRTMTWTGPGAPSQEGHNSIGVTSPEETWYLPEGSSEWGFETWTLVQNPGNRDAEVTLIYMIEGSGPRSLTRKVPAHSRVTYSMTSDIGQADASTMVSSNVPVIAERSMYRNDRREGHCSIGATSPADTFYLAEGTTAWGFTTYVLVQNPNDTDAGVTITYMTPEGPKEQPSFTMPPSSRKTIRVNDVGDVSNTDLSTMVASDVPVIAERAMYWGAGTPLGEACHDSIGLSSPYASFFLPDGQTSDGRETWTLVQNPNDSEVQVEVSYLMANGAGRTSFLAAVPARSRMTLNMADMVTPMRASVQVTCLSAGKGILVERSMYWNSRGAGTDTIGGYSD